MSSSTPRDKRGWLRLATIDITPLRRHRDFRLLFVGRLVSFFGSMITVVAVPFQVYQLSHSVLLVGSLGLVELAALVGFAMLGGALADAADRRVMVLLSEETQRGLSSRARDILALDDRLNDELSAAGSGASGFMK